MPGGGDESGWQMGRAQDGSNQPCNSIGFINCNIDYSRFQPFNASFHFRTSDIDRSNFIVKTSKANIVFFITFSIYDG